MTFSELKYLIDQIVPDGEYSAEEMNFLLLEILKYAQAQGGSGGAGGSVVLKVNGTENVSQALLDLRDGGDIAIVDNGDGTVSISYTGSGGGSFPAGVQGNMLQYGMSDWDVVMAITDAVGMVSVDYDNRESYDLFGIISTDWENRNMYDVYGVESIKWSDRHLNDTAESISIDWEQRLQHDSAGVESIDWESRQLLDSMGGVALDWSMGISLGGLPAGVQGNMLQHDGSDWIAAMSIFDASGVASILYEEREMYDGVNNISANWLQRFLYDNAGTTSASWDSRVLYDAYVGTSLEWGYRFMKDSASIKSIDWEQRRGYDQLEVISIQWDERQLYDSSNIYALSWDRRDMHDHNEILSIHWENRELYDFMAVPSLEYNSRNLNDINSATLLNWQEDYVDFYSTISTTPTATGSLPVPSGYFGGSSQMLGEPDEWLAVKKNGTTYHIPLYS